MNIEDAWASRNFNFGKKYIPDFSVELRDFQKYSLCLAHASFTVGMQ